MTMSSFPNPKQDGFTDQAANSKVRQSVVELQHLPEEKGQIPAARTQPITALPGCPPTLGSGPEPNPNNVSGAQTHREEYEHNRCATACRKLSGLRLHEQQLPKLRRDDQAWFLRN